MNDNHELAKLDREFTVSATMRPEVFAAKRAEILARTVVRRQSAPAMTAATKPAPNAEPDDLENDHTVCTRSFFASVLAPVVRAIGKAMKSDRDKLLERIKALEDRLPLAYGGTWSEAQESIKGTFYTDHGSIWYCRETTRERPGTSAAFTLACKRGSDR